MNRGDLRDGGQATVELALVLPLIVMLALAVAQIALVQRDRVLVAHAAREAARAAAVDPEPEVAHQAARRSGSLDAGRLRVQLSGGTTTGELLTATVVYSSPTDLPLVGVFLGDVEIREAVVMRVE